MMQKKQQPTTPRYLWATLLVVLLAAVGCTMPQPPGGTPGATAESTTAASTPPAESTPAETAGDPTSDSLVNTSWQLTAFGPAAAALPVVPDSTVTLEFSADGMAGGNTGCNSYGGDYTAEGDTLSFGEMVSTLMACADETVMAQEQAYLAALQTANRFEVTADQLTIWYDEGNSQLNFAAASANTQEPPAADDPSAVVGDEMAERVEFAEGATETTLNGTITAGSDQQYALAASAGQMIRVQTVSDGTPVTITVYGPDGASWVGEAQDDDSTVTVEVTAPENGDYLVTLSLPAESAETTYEVTFMVDAIAAQPGPVTRVAFTPDGNPTQRSGELADGAVVQQYLLSTNAGVTLTVDATSDAVPLNMTIESPSGNQWIPEMMPADDGYTIGREFTTPEPGYYLVTLVKGEGTPQTNFTIAFTQQS